MSEIENTETVEAAEPTELTEPTEPTEPTELPQVDQLSEPARSPKRRVRGTTLFTTAIVLGVLGGVGTGYAVQAARPATPLPSLAGTEPKYAPPAVYQGIAPAMLPSSQDDAALTDGDLTKLLLPVPAGASTDDSGWLDQSMDVEEDSDLCDNPVQCFGEDYVDGVVAIADTNWVQNGYYVEIRMFRFAPGESKSARDWAQDGANVTNGITMPSEIDASGYEYVDSNGDNDDTAWAVHGDITVKFWVTSSNRVPNPSIINKVITQQMGRL